LQALAMLESGAADAAGLDDGDLAIVCGSHHGGAEQAAKVRSLLAKSGLEPYRLGCGAREPGDGREPGAWSDGHGSDGASGGGARDPYADVLADMCSGKHAGMLTACKHLRLPLDSYLDPDHPWQKRILETVCAYCAADPARVEQAVDGCSAPTFSLPIYNMALGFARLAKEAAEPGPAARLLRSMAGHPAHTGEPDLRGFPSDKASSAVISATIGAAFVAKGGANGLHCAAIPGLELGFAMKVIDGAALPRWPVFTRALELAGILSKSTADAMRASVWPRILTRRGAEAGSIRLDF
jgi:L-asparaginase II